MAPRNPFAVPLPSAARSGEYGYPGETFAFPSTVVTDDVTYPQETDGERGVQALHSNSGDVFQDSNPEYAGRYELEYMNTVGLVPAYTEQVPAPGSQSLSAPRNAGEIAGTNRIIQSDGPVRGDGADGGNSWTGQRDAAYKPNMQYNGPVSGGRDYGTNVQLAYFASQAAMLSQQAIDSAMVSAV
jgi:hypothetical protein